MGRASRTWAILTYAALVACGGAIRSNGSRPEGNDVDGGGLRAGDAAFDGSTAESEASTDAGGAAGPVPAVELCNAPPGPSSDPYACPQSLCGNGTIDTCTVGSKHNTASEACDGADLGSQTCALLGFSGGSLACGPQCDLDTHGCDSCGSDPRVVACVHANVDPNALANQGPGVSAELALAATDSEIDVAWIEDSASGTSSSGPGLHFTRFRSDLTLLSDTRCFGPLDATGVSLASAGQGWLVVTGTSQGFVVSRLDALGHFVGSREVARGAWTAVQLTGGPNGGALVTWREQNGGSTAQPLYAMLLAADGSSVWGPVSVTPTSLWSWSAAFTGDGFLLASIVIDPTSQGQSASLYRLETDGTLSARGAIGGDTSSPSKVSTAWSGSDLRVWYDGPWNADPTKTGTLLQRVGPDGTLIGSPVSLDGAEYGPMHLLTLAQDTLMVRDAYQDSGSTLRLLRLAPSGIAAWPETKVVHTDNKPPAQDMALQAGDAIVAWTDDSRLSLERIRIAP